MDSFPLTDADSFNNSPVLLPSTASEGENLELFFTDKEGLFQSGDQFLLLTDAIACWAMKRQEKTGDAIATLLDLNEQNQLVSLVDRAREETDEEGRPLMRNDDVTFLFVEVH